MTLVVGTGMAGIVGAAGAGEVLVTSDITVSTIWTADNTYNLQQQIYVKNGATLTIQAGTIVASTTNIGGSLAVTAGSKIYVQGTQMKPVIMTSKRDVSTWTNGDPKTGTWNESCLEWGNLTIMGKAYIGSCWPGNTASPNANNVARMEGLLGSGPEVMYGGGDDDDNSGAINFLSLRYGGKVVAIADELNGLSLGGIGRGTDIHHVEIMNNVDDGIEIWGGTVNLKYISIWNIGDDSFDIDQGWRGKAQFGLIVQGFSRDYKQGGGVGDNCFETDGAEGSDYQPVTSACIYNFTAIGQPDDGDHATAWRDNARLQYRNCIFTDIGDEIVRFDDKGDHTCPTWGYGQSGHLPWSALWTTEANVYATVNAPANPAAFYKAQQVPGKLCEISDSVFYNNNSGGYVEADARGVFNAANNNVKDPANSPIMSITRHAKEVRGTKDMYRVIKLDPRPQYDGATSVKFADPKDGFFSSARYRGAFAPGNNWLRHWTASEAYGITQKDPWADLGHALAGVKGDPVLSGSGTFTAGNPVGFKLTNAAPSSTVFVTLGTSRWNAPLLGGILVPNYSTLGLLVLSTNANGELELSNLISHWPANYPSGQTFYIQMWIPDAAAAQGVAASNAISGTTP